MNRPLRFLIAALCLMWLSSPGIAANDDTPPVLHKGINLSNWLANARRQPLFMRDFIQLKGAGFDNVRIPFDPEYFGFKLEQGSDSVNHMDFTELDRAIAMSIDQGLPVVLDVHPGLDFVVTLQNNDWAQKEVVDLWAVLAARYKKYPANMLAFSLLNEPQYYKMESRYADFARSMVKAVRSVDTKHLIIVGAPHGSSIEGLLLVEPIDDPRIAYDFHFYEPYIITHQGIHSGFDDKMIRYFRHVPYPSSLVHGNAGQYTEKAPNPMQAQSELDEYTGANWNAEHIAQRLKTAKDWADATRTHLICGEFGVLRERIDPESRYRWISDVRKALEADHIGWQLWDYTDGFGIAELHGKTETDPDGAVKIVDSEHGSRTLEPAAILAMGLTP